MSVCPPLAFLDSARAGVAGRGAGGKVHIRPGRGGGQPKQHSGGGAPVRVEGVAGCEEGARVPGTGSHLARLRGCSISALSVRQSKGGPCSAGGGHEELQVARVSGGRDTGSADGGVEMGDDRTVGERRGRDGVLFPIHTAREARQMGENANAICKWRDGFPGALERMFIRIFGLFSACISGRLLRSNCRGAANGSRRLMNDF